MKTKGFETEKNFSQNSVMHTPMTEVSSDMIERHYTILLEALDAKMDAMIEAIRNTEENLCAQIDKYIRETIEKTEKFKSDMKQFGMNL